MGEYFETRNEIEPFQGNGDMTKTFSTSVDGLYIQNMGGDSLTFTVGSQKFTVTAGGEFDDMIDSFTTVTIQANGPFRGWGRQSGVAKKIGIWSKSKFSPLSYGAKFDGTTDDTSAIQQAINAAISNGGGVVEFPKGTSIVNGLTISNASNVTLLATKGATILKETSPVQYGQIYVSNSNNINIKGLTIQGTNTTISNLDGYSYHGIRVDSSNYVNIEDCEVYQMTSGGIFATNSTYIKVTGNYLHDNKDMYDICLGYASPSLSLEGYWIDKNICHSLNRWGIHVMGYGKNVNITNNHVAHKHEYGILLYRKDDANVNYWENVAVTNNIVEDISHNTDPNLTYYSGMGIYLQSGKKLVCNSNIVRNTLQNRTESPIIRTLATGAISIGGSTEVTCVGNLIEKSVLDGIYVVDGQNEGTVVADNTILEVKQVGVFLNGGNSVNITGNNISKQDNTGNAGIIAYSNSSFNTNQVLIANNNIKGYASGIVADMASGTAITDVIISSNLIFDATNPYITANHVTDVVISNNLIKANTINANTSTYAVNVVSCSYPSINGNVLTGNATYKLSRGINVSSSTNGLIVNNIVSNCSDVYYSLNSGGNTNVFVYSNKTDRQPMPMIGQHVIGNESDLLNGTAYKVIYKTSIPTSSDGNFTQGSICYNLAPTETGTTGSMYVVEKWICVASGTPGTWKECRVLTGN